MDLMTKVAGFAGATCIRNWMHSLDYRACYYDRRVDPVLGVEEPRIYVFWHEYILFPIALRGRCHMAMLLSRHRDADVLARVAGHLGFETVRGSTFRGGSAAMRELMRRGRNTHLAITPDGPRGPRRQLAQGPIYLASRLGMPIVPLGFAFDRPWRAKSWDRFAIPRPGGRARGIAGPAVRISSGLDRDGIEECRVRVERLLNQLTSEAERWAASAERRLGEVVVFPQTAPSRPRVAERGLDEAAETEGTIPLRVAG